MSEYACPRCGGDTRKTGSTYYCETCRWHFDADYMVGYHSRDARVAKLEATIERLRVCGNCEEWNEAGGRCYASSDKVTWTKHYDPCHFTPSRWTERSAP